MKKSGSLVFASAFVLNLLLGSLAFAMNAADAKTKADSYAEKAKAMDAVIAEHKQMKATPGLAKDDAMQIHCGKAISDAEKLKKDYEWFAKYYQAQAGGQ